MVTYNIPRHERMQSCLTRLDFKDLMALAKYFIDYTLEAGHTPINKRVDLEVSTLLHGELHRKTIQSRGELYILDLTDNKGGQRILRKISIPIAPVMSKIISQMCLALENKPLDQTSDLITYWFDFDISCRFNQQPSTPIKSTHTNYLKHGIYEVRFTNKMSDLELLEFFERCEKNSLEKKKQL